MVKCHEHEGIKCDFGEAIRRKQNIKYKTRITQKCVISLHTVLQGCLVYLYVTWSLSVTLRLTRYSVEDTD